MTGMELIAAIAVIAAAVAAAVRLPSNTVPAVGATPTGRPQVVKHSDCACQLQLY